MSHDDTSIREQYDRRGPERFYRESGALYRNPHEPELIAALEEALKRWRPERPSPLPQATVIPSVLARDLHAEVGQLSRGDSSPSTARDDSVSKFRPPSQPDRHDLHFDLSHVLDLAAGSGEITMALRSRGADDIHGIDPYTFDAYQARTGTPAERMTFDQIIEGGLTGRSYSLIVCSFGMHLCERSKLPALCLQLSQIAPALLIFTPHKRPVIQEKWGWKLVGELVEQRVRARFYRSKLTASASG